jgi:DNA-directed RNA polymerase specialized sigma subunit
MLEKIRLMDELINTKIAEYNKLLTMATSMTATNDGMPHGTDVSRKVENSAIKLAELSKDIDQQIDMYVDHKNEICRLLEKLPALQYGVLHKYYVLNQPWKQVAEEMGYSEVQIWRIRKKAVENLKNVIECNVKK